MDVFHRLSDPCAKTIAVVAGKQSAVDLTRASASSCLPGLLRAPCIWGKSDIKAANMKATIYRKTGPAQEILGTVQA